MFKKIFIKVFKVTTILPQTNPQGSLDAINFILTKQRRKEAYLPIFEPKV